jgi:two-component SAPR family response regulator
MKTLHIVLWPLIEFCFRAFESYNCIIDYLVKPITKDRFEKTILKVNAIGSNG